MPLRMRNALLLALVALTLGAPNASAAVVDDIVGERHCALPTSVECIQDWVDAVFDGRWVRTIMCLAGDPHCPYA